MPVTFTCGRRASRHNDATPAPQPDLENAVAILRRTGGGEKHGIKSRPEACLGLLDQDAAIKKGVAGCF